MLLRLYRYDASDAVKQAWFLAIDRPRERNATRAATLQRLRECVTEPGDVEELANAVSDLGVWVPKLLGVLEPDEIAAVAHLGAIVAPLTRADRFQVAEADEKLRAFPWPPSISPVARLSRKILGQFQGAPPGVSG